MAKALQRWLVAGIAPALGVACALAAGEVSNSKFADAVRSKTTVSGRGARKIDVAERNMERAIALRKKLTERDLKSAIQLFTDSARTFSEVGLKHKAAFAELEVGDTNQMMSRYPSAIAAYRRSLALAGDQAQPRCAALSHMARTYANVGRAVEAARYSDSAVVACQAASDKKIVADSLEAQGEAKFSANLKEAIASFSHARELATDANDPDGEALSTMMLAYAVNFSDRTQSPQLARTALDLWLKSQNLYGAARAHMTLAYFAAGAGNFQLAQCHTEPALRVFQRIGDKDNEAIALNVLGMLGRQSGDIAASIAQYRRARIAFAGIQDDLGEAESITGIADDLVSQHRYQGLLPLYTRKLYLAQKTGDRALLASALVDIAAVYQAEHRYSEADSHYRRGLAEYRKAGNRDGEGTALIRLAGLRSEQRKFDESVELYEQARKLRENDGELEDLARVQYSLARIYWKLNQLDEARSEIEKTIELIESQRLRIAKFDTRAQYFSFVHEYYSLYVQVLMALHKVHPEKKYNELALEASERSKVRALLDLLQNTSSSPSCDELLARGADAGTIRQTEWSASPEATSAHPLKLAQIESQLGDDSVLLEYALGDDRSYAWLVDGTNVSQFELGPAAEIGSKARAFRHALTPVVALEHETSLAYLQRCRAAKHVQSAKGRELAEVLMGVLNLPRKRLLIVPDGPLQYVPFAALPFPGTKGTTPLIEHHEVVMLPSASALAVLRNIAANRLPPGNGVAVFADPVFEKEDKPASASGAANNTVPRSRDLNRALRDSSGWQRIPSLPGSRIEALAIQRIVGPEHVHLAMGFDANRHSVMEDWIADYRIVHFATHGIVDTRHPDMSGLILSLLNARGEPQDGYLRLSDIYKLKLTADLVVLSSCESALGKDLGSEGTIGLPRGFLYAGARSVIASLWKADDDATATLMKALYSRLQRGENVSKALNGSQLELSKDSRFSDPYYWAGFVLEGDFK